MAALGNYGSLPTPYSAFLVKITKSILESPPPAVGEAAHQLFKVLFKQHASGIYRLAHSQLRSHAEAQEVVQDSFLHYWEKRHEVSSEPAAIKGYLYTSASHAILNQLRRRRRWAYQECPDDLLLEPEPQTIALEYQELSDLYTAALSQLPAKRQQIFVLSREEGLSNASIGQQLGISVKTVEAQITHALKFLRTYLRAHGTVLLLALLLLPASWRG